MKEKANTMVRQTNKERKKTAVLQWVNLAKPKLSLQLFFFSSVADGAVPVSVGSSPLFRGSPSVAWSVISIVTSMHSRPTDRPDSKESKRKPNPVIYYIHGVNTPIIANGLLLLLSQSK